MVALRPTALCLLLAFGSPVHAAIHCVSDAATLQLALDAAVASPEPDEIRLVTGEFELPAAGVTYSHESDEARDLHVSGGYEPGCTQRKRGRKTTLDAIQVVADHAMRIEVTGSDLRISNLVFVKKPSNGQPVINGALRVQSFSGNVTIEASAFFLNSGYRASALIANAPNGHVLLEDNLITANQSGEGAAIIGTGAISCVVQNNTVTGNHATGSTGGITVRECQSAVLRNNIAWGNDGYDVSLFANSFPDAAYHLYHNDIGQAFIAPTLAITEVGRTDVDPQFASGLFNYEPVESSTLVNAGDPATSYELNPLDYNDNPRNAGGVADIGAIESYLTTFRDGFE